MGMGMGILGIKGILMVTMINTISNLIRPSNLIQRSYWNEHGDGDDGRRGDGFTSKTVPALSSCLTAISTQDLTYSSRGLSVSNSDTYSHDTQTTTVVSSLSPNHHHIPIAAIAFSFISISTSTSISVSISIPISISISVDVTMFIVLHCVQLNL